jgi:hypothetical protein
MSIGEQKAKVKKAVILVVGQFEIVGTLAIHSPYHTVMLKGYVRNYWDVEKSTRVDFSFGADADSAMVWKTRAEADTACAMFDHQNIRIPSASGGDHVCRGFKSEERKPSEFVVFCEAPFILKQASAR